MLAELEYDHTLYEKDRAGDDKLYVRFFQDVLPDPEESARTGMRKFRDADMVTIMVPGDKRNIITREARPDDQERFAKQWKMYKADHEEQLQGYPLKEWPLISRSMAEEFKYLGFRTVEHIANASDAVLSRYPGMREVQSRAKTWLAAQADAAPLERLQTELKTRDEQIAAQAAQMAEMQKQIAALAKK